MGAKGTGIIFGGGVYVAENTSRAASVELSAKRRTTEAQSVAQVSIGRSRPGDFIVKKAVEAFFTVTNPARISRAGFVTV